ncbi:MAG: tRNA (uridine(34)/cytosine(34)/5-carboxymethylaminomethyluridine(34)-2'-O)-methyltransferase TrmL [Nitrosomonas sp.]|nr:tRNA (uridine(34)/cytosine(34)/5-carboxymethylaminomethyluridine(34)-2'-O)-methyltransferase TrmL [Nitrosomonas sp.]
MSAFNIVLYQPEIPPNTGNIIRLCANTGSDLHLIKPFGFQLNNKQLLRAGLDYHEFINLITHNNWEDCIRSLTNKRIFAVSTKGKQRLDQVSFQKEDTFIFGSESRGLPAEILASFPDDRKIFIPMLPNRRSLNLSNAAAIIVYEAWRQLGYALDESADNCDQ